MSWARPTLASGIEMQHGMLFLMPCMVPGNSLPNTIWKRYSLFENKDVEARGLFRTVGFFMIML